jgi:hypothetical protein
MFVLISAGLLIIGCIRTLSTSFQSGRPIMAGIVLEAQEEVQDHLSRMVDRR